MIALCPIGMSHIIFTDLLMAVSRYQPDASHRNVRDPNVILDNAYDYYRNKIKRDPDSGFRYLINHDQFSLRDYLSFVEYDYATIEEMRLTC